MASITGRVFNIQRFCTEDGPGIRTTVFLKGCPLKCLWCSNPESQSLSQQPLYRESLCNGCGECIKACSCKAISPVPDTDGIKIEIDRNKCRNCGACIDACTAAAIKHSSKIITAEEVFEEVKKDVGYYLKSQGGVTASGGEPLLQADFLIEFFSRCKALGIHTALETCGYVDTPVLERVLETVDLVMMDIKMMDSERHKEFTGVPNGIILKNVRSVANSKTPMIIRIPLIPGINDSEANLKDTALFVSELNIHCNVELLPYHNFGVNKYKMLGKNYQLNDIKSPDGEHMDRCREVFMHHGLECKVI